MRKNLPAEIFPPVEIPAGLGPAGVDGAESRDRVEGDAGAVALLFKAAHTLVLDDELFRNKVGCTQCNDQMTAAAAPGAGRKIGMIGNGCTTTFIPAIGDLCFEVPGGG